MFVVSCEQQIMSSRTVCNPWAAYLRLVMYSRVKIFYESLVLTLRAKNLVKSLHVYTQLTDMMMTVSVGICVHLYVD